MFTRNIIKGKVHLFRNVRSYSTKPSGSSFTLKYIAGGFLLGSGATLIYSYTSNLKSSNSTNKSTISVSDLPKLVYGDEKQLQLAIEELKTKINPLNITQHPDTILSHSDNGCNPIKPLDSQKPRYVVFAESTEEVSEILKVMHKYKIPTIPFGGGTSLEQHFFTTRDNSVVLNTSRMNKVLKINEDDLDASVQCGVTWNQLNDTLAELPLTVSGGSCLKFGCDCGLNANMSGMIATNASGIGAQKHGSMVQNVISITAVLADGTIVKTRQRPRKSSAGYNLTGLFSGSEGTLGVVTECIVKLTVVDPIETVCVVQFDDLYKASGAVSKFAQKGLVLDAIEMLDPNMMKAVNFSSQVNQTFDIKPTLFMKLSGINNVVVDEMVKEVKKISEEQGSSSFKFAKDKEEELELFAARKNALWIMLDYGYELFGEDVKLWITDAAVPLSKAAEYLKRSNEIVEKAGLTSVTVAHLGAGNFHIDLYYLPHQLPVCEKVVKDMCKLSIELEGTITGEHGIGLGKKELLPLEIGDASVDLMRKIKLSLDPNAILNPDKVIKIDPEEKFNGTWSGKY